MSNSTSLVIVVNKPDDTELELTAACGSSFEQIGRAVEMSLEVNGIKSGDWSSLLVTIVPPNAPAKRGRPILSVVN